MHRLFFSVLILGLPCEFLAQGDQKPVTVSGQAPGIHEPQTNQEPHSTSSKAQTVIKDLEARQERLGFAPEGYEYFDGEGYRLLVPAPMELEGRGDRVTQVSTMGTRMLVLAGDPIEVDDSNDGAMLNAFGEFIGEVFHKAWWLQYPKVKIGKHWGWNIGVRVDNYAGTAAGFIGKGRIIPIICVNQEEKLVFDPYTSKQEQELTWARFRAQRADERNTESMCQAIFQSVVLEEDEGETFPKPSDLYDRNKAARSATVLQQAPLEQAPGAGPTLGDLGRSQRARPATHVFSFEGIGDPDRVPAGFRWLDLSGICRPECNSSRALIPAAATAIPSYPEVFQMALDKAVISLFAGGLRTWTGTASVAPSLWQQEKFAVPAFYVRLSSDPTLTTLYEEENVIHGIQAKISRVRLVDAAGNVLLGEGAVFKVTGNVGIGCLIPENKFGEFEPVCARMIDSFQVQ